MDQHVIRNPVPTPEQMADMLGVSPERVKKLRGIMRAPTTGAFVQRRSASGVKQSPARAKVSVMMKKNKDAARAQTEAR